MNWSCFVGVQTNVSYGSDPAQIMDLYLPAGDPSKVSKVILLIHGGGWAAGSKEGFNYVIPFYRAAFPSYAIANMEYRLATADKPGYPKQLIDVDTAIKFLRSKSPQNLTFALVGGSAGAHLSLLYGYAYDYAKVVKVVVNIVGPADLTDPAYAWNTAYNMAYFAFIGPNYYYAKPGLYFETSPVAWINANSPKTISFYGNQDPLVPASQGPILKARLDLAKVTNELSVYPGGHGDWAAQYQLDMTNKTKTFLTKWF